MSIFLSGRRRFLCALLCTGAVTCAAEVSAHNNDVHANMTDLAWQTMRLVAVHVHHLDSCGLGDTAFLDAPPAGVSDADWKQFLADIAAAVPKMDGLPADLPPGCDPSFPGNGFLKWGNLGDIPYPSAL